MDKTLLFIVLCVTLVLGCAKKEIAQIPAENFGPPTDSPPTQPVQPAQTRLSGQAKEAVSPVSELAQNPFLTDEEEKFAGLGKVIPIDYLAVSAILYSSSNRSKAIIDGKILEVGGSVDNKKIVEILPEAVILKDAQAEYIVQLRKIS